MTELSKKIIEKYMIRKTKRQKESFRNFITDEVSSLGYETKIDTHKDIAKSNNVIVGDINKAKVILTAHYDTPPNFFLPIITLPKNLILTLLLQCIPVVLFFIAFGFTLGAFNITNILIPMILIYIFLIWFLFIGIPNKNNYNDNTSGVVLLTEVMCNIEKELRDDVAFIFFDNEEKGLLGSSGFNKKNKHILYDKIILNYDCVSDGEHILIVVKKHLLKNKTLIENMESSFYSSEKFNVMIESDKKVFYPSDQFVFKNGIGIASLRKNKFLGYMLDRVHTSRDKNFSEENITYLKNATIKFIKTFS